MAPPALTCAALLHQSGLDRSDALALFTHVSGKNYAWLIAHDRDLADPEWVARFDQLAARRRTGEPVAYITGQREFFSREFQVSPSVLIPRPETELLVELALMHTPPDARILDLGTGSGCIPITLKLERQDLQVTAVDISPASLAVAESNAQRLGAKIHFVESDWFSALPDTSFELIISNPPYIEADDAHLMQGDLRFEPRHALTDEADGLAHLRRIVTTSRQYLATDGWLLFEHGWNQGPACRELLDTAGFCKVQSWHDLAGHERISGGCYTPD